MMNSRVSILVVLVAGTLGGCVTDADSSDPDSDSNSDLGSDPGTDSAERRRPRPTPPPPPPAPAPAPDPAPGCSLIGGPSTLAATLDAFHYEVTGGPTGTGDGVSLRMTQDGSVTLQTRERGTEQGHLDSLTLYGLFRRAITADLPTLCATYSCSGCSNDYVHNLTLWFSGVPYTVRAGFLATQPARLDALLDWVRDITTRPLQ
jgi:hypothetical protein